MSEDVVDSLPILHSAKELSQELSASGIQTIRGLMGWLEVTDTQGFIAVIEEQVAHLEHLGPTSGKTGYAVVTAFCIALGVRLARRGLL